MIPILSYPALEGMSYPRLQSMGCIRVIEGPQQLIALPQDERRSVRVLMTSASRGCSAEVATALPNLEFVISQGVGAEKIDHAALGQRGIVLRCVGEALTDDVADLAMALMQMLGRNLILANSFARNEWQSGRFKVGQSLVGKTLGIAGLSGRIGQAIAARAVVSRMRIAGLQRRSNQGLGADLFETWEALAAASDILVLALPGSPELKHIIGRAELRALGPKGFLVNVARGSLVDTEALLLALEEGTVGGAALDVLESEPVIPPRLAALSNVILTPHIGGQTWGQRARAAKIAEDEILAFLDRPQLQTGKLQ